MDPHSVYMPLDMCLPLAGVIMLAAAGYEYTTLQVRAVRPNDVNKCVNRAPAVLPLFMEQGVPLLPA